MKPLRELDPGPIRFVAADIDDTLSTAGKLDVNGWFGRYDKLATLRQLFAELAAHLLRKR
jgi:hypothetical protein